MSDHDDHYEIIAELGEARVEVSGTDEAWVEEQFVEQWGDVQQAAEDMARAVRGNKGEYQ